MKIELPIKTVSEANMREHWRVKNARRKWQREIVCSALRFHLYGKPPVLPVIVTLTRIGKRKLDSDNLQSAFKAIRDEIADAYGVDDGSDMYTWEYRQEIGRQYAVRIEVTSV